MLGGRLQTPALLKGTGIMNRELKQQVEKEIQQHLSEIAAAREDANRHGHRFACLTEEELSKRISDDTPYIGAVGWSGNSRPGDKAYVMIWISNPGPVVQYGMFVSIFFGIANFVADIGVALAGRDQRWPVLSTRFTLAAGDTVTPRLTYTVPRGIPLTEYVGNVVLWQEGGFDTGTYLGRASFDLEVT
jgi:hypothetical protein